ncbi:MAG: hypothetical protein ACE5IJ_00740 [Thermoplasmata archaeon]
MDVEKAREEVRRRRKADLERDARALRDKSPEETLRMFFDMCEFVQKLRMARVVGPEHNPPTE